MGGGEIKRMDPKIEEHNVLSRRGLSLHLWIKNAGVSYSMSNSVSSKRILMRTYPLTFGICKLFIGLRDSTIELRHRLQFWFLK